MVASLSDHDREIRRLAYLDPLTELPNRLMFRELIDQAMAEQSQLHDGLGLLFIDLDDFKRINDTLGHDVGDGVLSEFAQRLQRRTTNVTGDSEGEGEGEGDRPLIARLGGDEFVALLSGANPRDRCERLAQDILRDLDPPFELAGRRLHLSASIGIASYPEDAFRTRQLLK